MAPLRDLPLLFFFLVLGAQLDLEVLGEVIPAALVFSAFVLVGNPLIVLIIMALLGYRKHTGFLAGLTVAQISEFSLIFIGLGVALGQVTEAELGLVTLVGLITIAASTYMITYSHWLYKRIEPVLGRFKRKRPVREEQDERQERKEPPAVILLGLAGLGGSGARWRPGCSSKRSPRSRSTMTPAWWRNGKGAAWTRFTATPRIPITSLNYRWHRRNGSSPPCAITART